MCSLARIRSVLVDRIEWRYLCTISRWQALLQDMYVPHQDPLLPQLALRIMLRAYFEEEVHELLEGLRLAGHDESYYVHEEARLCVAVQHDGEDLLLFGGQTLCSTGAGFGSGCGRTIVSIFCSSLPFSRAVLSSFSEGTSAALSWCTCCCPSALRSSCYTARCSIHTRLYAFSRNVAMMPL